MRRDALLSLIGTGALIAVLMAAFNLNGRIWLPIAGAGWLAWWGFKAWWDQHGSPAMVRGLQAHWLDVPGAHAEAGQRICIHRGRRRLKVRLGRQRGRLTATIQLVIGDATVALRAWPEKQRPPSLDPDGAPVGGPPVSRAPMVEARFAHRVRVDSSDPERAERLLQGSMAVAIHEAMEHLGPDFAGITYDGRLLGIHFCGPIAADPEQALRIARPLWERFGTVDPDPSPTPLAL
jgi:hypothetical protein